MIDGTGIGTVSGRGYRAVLLTALVALVLLAGASGGEAAAPSNDHFAAAQVLASSSGSLSTSNAEATMEPGEPAHAGDDGGSSLWFTWTPGAAGVASLSTSGSEVDTLLAIYTGSSVNALTLLASNDETLAGDGTSRACFPVSAGMTYKIAVDGYLAETGAIEFVWGMKSDSGSCATLPPVISAPGAPKVGAVMTGSSGTFSDAVASSAFQWLRCGGGDCRLIAGATGSSYVTTSRDVGTSLRLVVVNGGAVNMSAPSPVIAMTPVIGPNGRIFFTSVYDVFSISPDGTGQKHLSTFPHSQATYPAPSPDGSLVALQLDNGIGLMNSDGTDPATSTIWGVLPDWSPDGSRIVFASGIENDWNISAIDADGTDIATLRQFYWPDTLHSLDWSPDGSKIAFSLTDPPLTARIMLVAADGRGPLTTLTFPSMTFPSKNDVLPAWSPDGTKLLFVRRDQPWSGDGDLYVMNADGSDQTLVFEGTESQPVAGADWSPDGTMIVIAREDRTVAPERSHLFIIPASGGSPVPLSTGAVSAWLPKWGALFTAPLPPLPPPGGGGGGGGGAGPDVEISLAASNAAPLANTTVEVRVAVRNASPNLAARGLRATITLPADATLLGAPAYETGNGCTGTATLSCDLDFLTPNTTSTLRFAINTGGAGVKQITAAATMSITDPNLANNDGVLTLDVRSSVPLLPAAVGARQGPTVKAITGNSRANTLVGTAGRDILRGLAGNDRLFGRGGDDTLIGGIGNDRLVGGPGRDKLDGGAGADTIETRDGARDTIVCGPGRDTVTADRTDIIGRSCEYVRRR